MLELPDHARTVLDALVIQARPIILEKFGPSSCIGSTRVGIDVLAYFGIPAKPVAVSLVIFNAEAVRVYEQTQDMLAVKAAALSVPQDVAGGAWTIGIGAPGDNRVYGKDDWPGHLVIGLKQYSVLADLSLDQAGRPLKNIAVKPTWYPVPEGWWTAESSDPAHFDGPDGSHLMVHRTQDQGYRVSPNWKPANAQYRRVLREVTGQVIVAMKGTGVEVTR